MNPATEQYLLAFINASPQVQSLLYDLDLLPEQLTPSSHTWDEMLLIVATMKTLMNEIAALKSEVKEITEAFDNR